MCDVHHLACLYRLSMAVSERSENEDRFTKPVFMMRKIIFVEEARGIQFLLVGISYMRPFGFPLPNILLAGQYRTIFLELGPASSNIFFWPSFSLLSGVPSGCR